MKNFFDYKQRLGEFETQYVEAVEEFLTEYPTLVSAAAFQLGDLYNAEEYPDVEKLRDKFRFKYVFLPVPEIGDFRVDVNEEHKAEIVKQFESFYESKLSEAMSDAWDRLHDCLSKMSEKLAGQDKQIFRDSLVNNAVDLCSLLTKLNVTNDSKLETARKQLESALIGVTPKDLRDDDALRKDTKAKVDEILSMF
jgi:hypothetical protein